MERERRENTFNHSLSSNKLAFPTLTSQQMPMHNYTDLTVSHRHPLSTLLERTSRHSVSTKILPDGRAVIFSYADNLLLEIAPKNLSNTSQFVHKPHQQSHSLFVFATTRLLFLSPYSWYVSESRCVSQLQSAANLFSHAVANPVQDTLLCFFYTVCTCIKAKGNYTF